MNLMPLIVIYFNLPSLIALWIACRVKPASLANFVMHKKFSVSIVGIGVVYIESLPYVYFFSFAKSIVLSLQQGLRIQERPVAFVRRVDKRSSVRIIPDTIEYLKNIWECYWRIRRCSK